MRALASERYVGRRTVLFCPTQATRTTSARWLLPFAKRRVENEHLKRGASNNLSDPPCVVRVPKGTPKKGEPESLPISRFGSALENLGPEALPLVRGTRRWTPSFRFMRGKVKSPATKSMNAAVNGRLRRYYDWLTEHFRKFRAADLERAEQRVGEKRPISRTHENAGF
jgi:hypothetical protein